MLLQVCDNTCMISWPEIEISDKQILHRPLYVGIPRGEGVRTVGECFDETCL